MTSWDELGKPALSVLELARWRERVIREMQCNAADHCECAPGVCVDGDVVCACGVVLGKMPKMQGEIPPSLSTAAAPTGKHVRVETEKGEIVSTEEVTSMVSPEDPIISRLAVIDPTRIYTPQEVQDHIADATARLERGAVYERFLAEAYGDAVIVHHNAVTWAEYKMKEHGSNGEERKAWARLQSEDQYTAMMVAKMKKDAIGATMHTLRSVLSAYQSIAKSISSIYSSGGSNG